jgi:hypothetical protein
LSDFWREQDDVTFKPGPREGTFVEDSPLSGEGVEVGEGDDGAVRSVFEEESGGQVSLKEAVEGRGCGGRDSDVSF